MDGLMADRVDLNFSVGPPRAAKPTPPTAAGEDPLAELARMMSDRSVFDPAPAIRRKTVPIPEAVSLRGDNQDERGASIWMRMGRG